MTKEPFCVRIQLEVDGFERPFIIVLSSHHKLICTSYPKLTCQKLKLVFLSSLNWWISCVILSVYKPVAKALFGEFRFYEFESVVLKRKIINQRDSQENREFDVKLHLSVKDIKWVLRTAGLANLGKNKGENKNGKQKSFYVS